MCQPASSSGTVFSHRSRTRPPGTKDHVRLSQPLDDLLRLREQSPHAVDRICE